MQVWPLLPSCNGLKKSSCGSCTFGAKGMNVVLDHCSSLEELSIKRLRGLTDGSAAKPIGPDVTASSLKTICIKDLYNGQCFGPLIMGSKNLRTLKLFRCSGDWDKLLEAMADRVTLKVKKNKGVTCEGADWLRASRDSLDVNLDTGEIDLQDAASVSDGGAQDNVLEFPPVISHISAVDIPSSSSG